MKKLLPILLSFLLLVFPLSSLFLPLPTSHFLTHFQAQAQAGQTQNPTSNFQYDQAGNLLDDEDREISWDVEGKPVRIKSKVKSQKSKVENQKSNVEEEIEVRFLYDSQGARIAKVVKNKSTGEVVSAILYLGSIEKDLITGEVTSYYPAGSSLAQRKVNSQTGEDELTFIHRDHLSSSTFFTDKQGNKKDNLLTYYPYGTEREGWDSQQITDNRKQITDRLYTGQIKDTETNLYYYNARYYNPKTGLFISPDTVADSLNRYSYTIGNPLIFNDPTGHQLDPVTVLMWASRIGSGMIRVGSGMFWVGGAVAGYGQVIEIGADIQAEYYQEYQETGQRNVAKELLLSFWWGRDDPLPTTPEEPQQLKAMGNVIKYSGVGISLGGVALVNTGVLVKTLSELACPCNIEAEKTAMRLKNIEEKYGLKVNYEAGRPGFAGGVHEYNPETGISTITGPKKMIISPHELGHTYQSQVLGQTESSTTPAREWYGSHPVAAIRSEMGADAFAAKEMFAAGERFYGSLYAARTVIDPLEYGLVSLRARLGIFGGIP